MFDDYSATLPTTSDNGVWAAMEEIAPRECPHRFSCLGALPNVAKAGSLCAYDNAKMRRAMKCPRHEEHGTLPNSVEYIMLRRLRTHGNRSHTEVHSGIGASHV